MSPCCARGIFFFFLDFTLLIDSQYTESVVQDVVHLSTVLKGTELRSNFLMLILTIILVMSLRIKRLFYERIHVTPRVYRKLWYRNRNMASVGSTKPAEQIPLNSCYTHVRSKQIHKHVVDDFFFSGVFITIS